MYHGIYHKCIPPLKVLPPGFWRVSFIAHHAVSLHMNKTTIEPYCLHLRENDEGFVTVR